MTFACDPTVAGFLHWLQISSTNAMQVDLGALILRSDKACFPHNHYSYLLSVTLIIPLFGTFARRAAES